MALCILPIAANPGLRVHYAQEFIVARPHGVEFEESPPRYGATVHATVLVERLADVPEPPVLLIYHLGEVAHLRDAAAALRNRRDPLSRAACRCWAPEALERDSDPDLPLVRVLRARGILPAPAEVEVLALSECPADADTSQPRLTQSWDDLQLSDDLLRCVLRPVFARFRVTGWGEAGFKLIRIRFNTDAEIVPPALDRTLCFPVQGPIPMIDIMARRVRRLATEKTTEREAFESQLSWIAQQRKSIGHFDILMTGPEFQRTKVEVDRGDPAAVEQTLMPARTFVPNAEGDCIVFAARFRSDDFGLRLIGRRPVNFDRSRTEGTAPDAAPVEYRVEKHRLSDSRSGRTIASLETYDNGTAFISWPAGVDAGRFIATAFHHLPRHQHARGQALKAAFRLRGAGRNVCHEVAWLPDELHGLLEDEVKAIGDDVRLVRFETDLGVLGLINPPPTVPAAATIGWLVQPQLEPDVTALAELLIDLYERTCAGRPAQWEVVRSWFQGAAAQVEEFFAARMEAEQNSGGEARRRRDSMASA